MKFLMNGCLLLATADGSAVEIAEEIGAENMVSSVRNLLQTVSPDDNCTCSQCG